MSPSVELNLALILLLPWFAILGGLFWYYPRQPRGRARLLFDSIALALALAAFVWSIHWSHHAAGRGYGRLWPQILATALGYGVFLGVLTLAFFIRQVWFRASAARASEQSSG